MECLLVWSIIFVLIAESNQTGQWRSMQQGIPTNKPTQINTHGT